MYNCVDKINWPMPEQSSMQTLMLLEFQNHS